MIEPFEVVWQPIVKVNEIPDLPFHPIVAGCLQLQLPTAQPLDAWWHDRLVDGTAEKMEAIFELSLERFLPEMQKVRRWHIPVHPLIEPSTRDWLPFWNDYRVKMNWVYEVPTDEIVDPSVWNEIELIRLAPNNSDIPITMAGTHVGRQGLTLELADALNQSPFSVLILDPSVTEGLNNVYGRDPVNDRRFDALYAFMHRLDEDWSVVATGITTAPQWHAARGCGVRYGMGDLWLPPTPLDETFTYYDPAADPAFYPDKIYPTAEAWCAVRGLQCFDVDQRRR